jgi:hypothetical protein
MLGRVVAELVSKLLEGMEFDTLPEKLGFAKPKEGAKRPSQLIGFIVIAAVMLFALVEAARILGFALLADIILEFTVFAGHVLMGLIILTIGIYLANLAFNAASSSGISRSKLPAYIAKVAILVFERRHGSAADGARK